MNSPSRTRLSYGILGRRMFGASLAGLALMYVAFLTPPFERWVESLEMGVSRRLNGLVLVDAVWDWTMLIVASEFWLLCSLVLAGVMALIGARRAIASDYGRLLGFALAAGATAFVAEEASDKISETIKRPLPIKTIDGMRDAARVYKPHLDMPDDTGLPDENVAGLACLALLLLIRARRTSGILLLMAALHCVAQISLGRRWLFDMGSAFLFGGAIGGGALWFGRSGFRWLEQKSEEAVLADFWRLLPKAWSRSLRLWTIDRRRLDLAGGSDLGPAPRGLTGRIWRKALAAEVEPLLGVPAERLRLLKRPPGTKSKGWKISRYVRFVQTPAGDLYVMKLAYRFGGFVRRPRRIRRYAQSAQCTIALERMGFAVPRLLWAKEGISHLGLVRYFVSVEEYLPGRNLDVHVDAEAAEGMETLARLHAVEREGWGPLTQQGKEPHISYVWQSLRPEVLGRIRRLAARNGEEWPEQIEERLWNRFEETACRLFEKSPPCFRLIHGDVGVRNFRFGARGVRLVDFLTVAYDLPAAELLRAVSIFGNGTTAQRSAAWQAYFKKAGEERWREFLAQANLGLARHALRELSHERIRLPGEKAGRTPEAIARWVEGLLDLPTEFWGGHPAFTDWDGVTAALEGRLPEKLPCSPTAAALDPPIPREGRGWSVCHVASHDGVYRGGAVQLTRMALAQRARGHSVSVIHHDPDRSQTDRQANEATWEALREAGIEVEAINLADGVGLNRLARRLRAGGFDVIHAHRDEALVACWLALRESGGPALVAQRGTISAPPELSAKALRSRRVRGVVAVAEAVREALTETARVPREKIEVIYGSVDPEIFRPVAPTPGLRRRLGIPEGDVVVGSLSAWRKAKGFEVLLPALAKVMATRPDVWGVFIGKGIPEKLEPAAKALGIADRCRFLGHQADVIPWLSIMSLTVCTATDREGLSGVLRESLAMEIPVLASDCAGNPEIVRDRKTGLLTPVGDRDALAKALEWAIAHPEEMKAMAAEGRRWVEEHCSPARQAELLEQIYAKAAAKSAALRAVSLNGPA